MEHPELVAYCLAKPGAWPDEPWEGDVVAKVGDKVFAFLGSGHAAGRPVGFAVKATVEDTLAWRALHPDHVAPAPYLQKTTWNRVLLPGTPGVPPGGPDDDELRELVDDSYDLIVAKLPRSKRPPPR